MNDIDIFNSLVLTFLAIFTMLWGLIVVFTGRFFKRDTRYIPLKKLIKTVVLTALILVSGIWLLSQFYIAFNNSHISLKKLGDDSFITAIFLASAILVSIFIASMVLILIKTIKTLLAYTNLKKDNIPNNLRHALYKRNFEAIISNHKLLKMSDEKASLSDEEILQLSAVLSNAGMNEDVQELLKIKLFKENTFWDDIFSVFPNQQSYNIQCSSENIEYNDKLKTALQKHAKVSKYVYISILIMAIFQSFIPIIQLITNTTPTNRERVTVLVIGIIIILAIIMKYIILKSIHQKSLNISDIKIKASAIDKIIFICQCIFIPKTIVGLLIS
ncbi:hypothetical protein U271_01871 [Staphylococcus aureus F70893]|uniref:hypothetical protein n=1 Tax=Staphylococcus aureus TaxID=1280 RepID=UPI0004510CC5|nr:hypothetical protein [Staphylococcus aureus]EVX44309.1 hypothetical protein U271_01871 [Staphylococcus aureus F70893]EVX61702.1 hypothetical protein U280_02609 [Staphylococcus aureus F77047]EWW99065.1 hypothetical protein V308_01986 [Staphylococcus aureus H81433]